MKYQHTTDLYSQASHAAAVEVHAFASSPASHGDLDLGDLAQDGFDLGDLGLGDLDLDDPDPGTGGGVGGQSLSPLRCPSPSQPPEALVRRLMTGLAFLV